MFFLLDIIGHENDPLPQCGHCNEIMVGPFFEHTVHPDLKNEVFCNEFCLNEALSDARIARYEAAREFELYGNDYDSWYR